MYKATSIRILEKENNLHGDLFGRLMADLFVALGYEQPRLNIHKSGRELDLSAKHRLEPRRALAECKATSDPIGGGDLNKFIGVLDVEHEDTHPITGYFISLGGFTETAVEQEIQRRRTKIVTLTAPQVVNELVEGRILIPKDRATELAGRCCVPLDTLVLDPEIELLAHERGWIWCVYFTHGKARTHFALIHSDGTPLARAIVDEVIAADGICGGSLERLCCLNPTPPSGADTDPRVVESLAAYREYLENECGMIQLDGLPADNDVGSRRLRLEHLFVPVHLDLSIEEESRVPTATGAMTQGEQEQQGQRGVGGAQHERQPIGAVLSSHCRLALLSAPGGGKSTLIKRLAVAYADAARREQIDDDLSQRDWLPLFFRCRELRGLARASFSELLDALAQREPVRQEVSAFRAYVDRALLEGRALLLVDGLDEISDPGDRAAFVCTLRATLQAYPNIAFVATSREAGFRHIAAHLAPVCTQAKLSVFNAADIRRLTVAWYREVVGDTQKVRADAMQLADSIVQNDRIRRLAINPLLLTTLLLVKRWVGSLPTRRTVLYDKAVEVLLMTWNTEGYDPLPEDEALPQLCYVASAMMLTGVQKISRARLAALLQDARHALPTELGYVKSTVDEFIQRVEERSSLLMMTGHDVENCKLVEFFEFRHLTFQEFLAARAMVEGWHPGRNDSDTLVSVLEPHFKQEEWREVIPLAALLGGKATESLILLLIDQVKKLGPRGGHPLPAVYLALVNCLSDEAAARPDTVRAAARELVRRGDWLERPLINSAGLARGKYGRDLRDEAGKALLGASPDLANVMPALAEVVFWQTVETEDSPGVVHATARFTEMINSSDRLVRCEGALGLMMVCFRVFVQSYEHSAELDGSLQRTGALLTPMLFSQDVREEAAASWALAWLGGIRVYAPQSEPDIIARLFSLWLRSPNDVCQNFAVWALASQPLVPRDDGSRCASVPRTDLLRVIHAKHGHIREKVASLIVAWYGRALPDEELRRRARGLLKDVGPTEKRTLLELLERLNGKRSARKTI